jgi:hypothetical protein
MLPEPFGRIVTLRIALRDIEPPIWRRVAVPERYSLRGLHDVIQAVFNWQDYHLHQFEIGEAVYGQTEIANDDFFPGRQFSDKNKMLYALLDSGVQRVLYRYDFGDDWEHVVEIESVDEPQQGVKYPCCSTERAPPEDCGGPLGFADFLEALGNKRHKNHRRMVEWYGGEFDGEGMDLHAVEARLDRVRARRQVKPAPKRRVRKRRGRATG